MVVGPEGEAEPHEGEAHWYGGNPIERMLKQYTCDWGHCGGSNHQDTGSAGQHSGADNGDAEQDCSEGIEHTSDRWERGKQAEVRFCGILPEEADEVDGKLGILLRDQGRDESLGEVEGGLQDEERPKHEVCDQPEYTELSHLAKVDPGDSDQGKYSFSEAEDVDVHPGLRGERGDFICGMNRLDDDVRQTCDDGRYGGHTSQC